MGRVYIFYGGETIRETPDITIIPSEEPLGMLESGDGIGDVNDDGYDDIAVCYYADSSFVKIYYGAANLTAGDTVFYSPDTLGHNLYMNVINDLNGDGKKEIGIIDNGVIIIYVDLKNYIAIDLVKYGTGGIAVFDAGDINNDSFEDFICFAPNHLNEDSVWVGGIWGFYGSKTIDTIPDFQFEGETRGSRFGEKVIGLGDINNDEYDEFAVLAPSFPDFNNPEGKLYVYSMQKITGVEIEEKEENKFNFSLKQNYPNPFNPNTTVGFTIPEDGNVKLELFNTLGQKIKTIADGLYKAGNNRINLDGESLTTGVYFYRMIYMNNIITKKMTLIR